MLNHNLKHHLLPSALLVTGFLTLTGCTNNDYDLNNVDATMGFGSESLVIPNSSTKEIQLKDVLDLKEGGCVVTDAAGNYLFQLTGGDVEAAYPYISPIILDVTNVFDGDISLSNAASTGAKARRAPGSSLHLASPKVMMFEYHGNDNAVKGLNEAEIDDTEISIRLDFSNISTAVSNIESATLTLPAYLSISHLVIKHGNGVPTHNGSKVTITDISTARPLELSLKTQKLDFTNHNDHGSLSINNGAIDLTGYFSIAMQCNVTGAMPDNPTIKAKIGVADRTITMDFLDDDDVVADLDNPQILLTVNNDMDVAATVSATAISTKEGRELARVTLPEMSVAKNGLSKICICRQKTSELTQQYGEANVYAVSNLSTLINRIPDHIKIVDVNAHAKPEMATIVFGEKYQVKPSYEVNAPLAFGEKANIVYEDSFTGWNDDIDKLDLAEGTYIEVTANVENKVPAYLIVKAYPVDAQGNKIEDKLLIEIPDEVAASTDGTTAVTTPITMKITPKVKNSLKQLDGLVFRLEGSAKSANGNKVTGISLNEREHTLKLNDIKVKIVGKIIGDFN
nr:hypothetical protein [uncultured Prevotella sp.]